MSDKQFSAISVINAMVTCLYVLAFQRIFHSAQTAMLLGLAISGSLFMLTILIGRLK